MADANDYIPNLPYDICLTLMHVLSDNKDEVVSMADTERITVRLQNDRAKALEKLVEIGRFPTVSDAIRAAVDEFVEANFTPEYIERITIDLPKGNVVELECLVKDGDSVSIDDAIRNAVREYTRKRIPKAMEDQL